MACRSATGKSDSIERQRKWKVAVGNMHNPSRHCRLRNYLFRAREKRLDSKDAGHPEGKEEIRGILLRKRRPKKTGSPWAVPTPERRRTVKVRGSFCMEKDFKQSGIIS